MAVRYFLFIDTMRPITAGERLAWGTYLNLPFTHWRAAQKFFAGPTAARTSKATFRNSSQTRASSTTSCCVPLRQRSGS